MTTYRELYSKVLLRLKSSEGEAQLVAKEAVNDAQKWIARVQDFPELKVYDITNAFTVDGTATYDLVTDWLLTRPKDIYTLVLYDTSSSRKLTYAPPASVDLNLPYPAILGEQRSLYYTVRKKNSITLYPTPDAAYAVYIHYSQWPLVLDADTDVCQFDYIDDVIIALATDITWAIQNGEASVDWLSRARLLLQGATGEETYKPDRFFIAQPFNPCGDPVSGEYWKMPFVRRNPT